MFRRWAALVVPLRCVVTRMGGTTFERVFRGAARRGVAALSALDASRLDMRPRLATDSPNFARSCRKIARRLRSFDSDPAFQRAMREIDAEDLSRMVGEQDLVTGLFTRSIAQNL